MDRSLRRACERVSKHEVGDGTVRPIDKNWIKTIVSIIVTTEVHSWGEIRAEMYLVFEIIFLWTVRILSMYCILSSC